MRRIDLRTFVFVFLAACSLGRFSWAEGQTDLRLRLRKGQRFSMRATVKQDMAPDSAQPARRMKQTRQTDELFEVLEVDGAGVATVRCTFIRSSFKAEGAMGTVEYDSSDPPEVVPSAARNLAALPGLHFIFTIGPDGSIRTVEGGDGVVEEMLRRIEPPAGFLLRAVLREDLSKQYGNAALKEMLGLRMPRYPGHSVGVGDSWETRSSLTTDWSLMVQTTWVLANRSHGISTIEFVGSIRSDPAGPARDIGVAKIAYALTGSRQGVFEVDEASGWPTRLTATRTLSGTVSRAGESATTRASHVSIKTEIVVESLPPPSN